VLPAASDVIEKRGRAKEALYKGNVADNSKDSLYRQFGKYSGLTFLIPACVLIGYTIGYFLDKAFGTSLLKIVFLLLGVVAGLIELVRELNKDDAGTK
jgi:F0F1-type ATP synthase assembly protein I